MRRLGLGVATLLLLATIPTGANASGAPAGAHALDKDGNKIFDDLDRKIDSSGNSHQFDVVVLFSGGTSGAQTKEAKSAVGPFSTSYSYSTLPAVAARMSAGQIKALAARSQTAQIQEQRQMTFAMASARAAYGSDKAQLDFGVDGNNESGACPGVKSYCADDVVVAVLDTGVDQSHVDLDAGKVLTARECMDGTCYPINNYSGSHGTHVASIIAGEGEADPANRGVAPGAGIVSVKVGSQFGAEEVGVDAGIEWVLANKAAYGIDLVNMSIASTPPSDGTDITSRLTNKLAAAGMTPIVAAGNTGPSTLSIGSPGASKFAVTVGAMGDPGASDWEIPLGFDLASFSGRGPTSDGRIKPDIVAAGVDITAADAAATENGYSHTGYASHSGTSQAAPFAAGVAALMVDANPALTSSGTACPTTDTSTECIDGVYDSTMQQPLKGALTASAVDWGPPGPDNDYGFGRLDAYAAVDAASSLSGSGGPAVPTHTYTEGNLPATGATATHALPVTNTTFPISITFVMPTWTSSTTPDFDIALLDPSGTQVATSLYRDKRQETIGYQPTTTGTYTLRVTSVNGSGPYWFDASYGGAAAPSPSPSTSPSPSPSPSATPPPTPTGVSANAASLTQINLAWSDCAGETGYKVERATASTGPWTNVTTVGANTTSYADRNLQSGTTYYYRLSSYNGGGSSAPSPTVSARTMSDTTAPSIPGSFKIVGGKGKVSLTWSASTDAGGSGLAGYKVFRSTASNGTYTQVGSVTTTSYTDVAVAARSTYYYYVIAYDGAGNNSAKTATLNAKVS